MNGSSMTVGRRAIVAECYMRRERVPWMRKGQPTSLDPVVQNAQRTMFVEWQRERIGLHVTHRPLEVHRDRLGGLCDRIQRLVQPRYGSAGIDGTGA